MSVRMYEFAQQQWIDRPVGEVFAFFCDAHNLEALTPPWLNFHIVSISPSTIKVGTQIQYRLRIHGLPMRWITVIREWEPPHCFVDEQLRGPYKLWHHTHSFESRDGRTLMKDQVRYQLPFGLLGELIHGLQVRRDVEQIFAYRRLVIAKLFGSP